MKYFKKVKKLYKMIEEGKLLDSIEMFYHKDVIITANNEKIRNGIEEAREYIKNFLKEIDEIFGVGILTITSDEERAITMVEFWLNVKLKNGNKEKIQEVAIQHWEGDFIVSEEFYSRNKNNYSLIF